MQDLSMNILDIADNSIKAGAKLIEISVCTENNILTITIKDDGCGMDKDFLSKVTDPYATTRKTRNVGLGIPLFKMEAEMAGGSFEIDSVLNKGTLVKATFQIHHIDRPPLGDLSDTITALLPACDNCDISLLFKKDKDSFVFDTRELKEQLNGESVSQPYVMQFVKEMLNENILTILGGTIL